MTILISDNFAVRAASPDSTTGNSTLGVPSSVVSGNGLAWLNPIGAPWRISGVSRPANTSGGVHTANALNLAGDNTSAGGNPDYLYPGLVYRPASGNELVRDVSIEVTGGVLQDPYYLFVQSILVARYDPAAGAGYAAVLDGATVRFQTFVPGSQADVATSGPGITVAPFYHRVSHEFVVSGANPTTLTLRTYDADDPSPTSPRTPLGTWTATDSTAGLQVAGTVGFSSRFAATTAVDSVVTRDLNASPPPPPSAVPPRHRHNPGRLGPF